jgi:Tol biopolymer transport system component
VAFASTSSNLAPSATRGFNVFVRDRGTSTTELIGAGWMPALSADGRYVAFASREGPILLRDRALETTENVSVGSSGTSLPGLGSVPTVSADGRFFEFLMEERIGFNDRRLFLYVRDTLQRTTDRVVEDAGNPTISADGRIVAFSLPAGGVFVRDVNGGTTELASTSSGQEPGNGDSYTGSGPLSADGRFVAFFSLASNLARADTNGAFDVFVRDRRGGTTELVSVARSWVLVARHLTLLSKRPMPGRAFAVTLRVASGDGGPVTAATVRCAARVGGRALRTASATFQSSTARCALRIPVRSHRAKLSGSISVSTPQDSLRRTFVIRVR